MDCMDNCGDLSRPMALRIFMFWVGHKENCTKRRFGPFFLLPIWSFGYPSLTCSCMNLCHSGGVSAICMLWGFRFSLMFLFHDALVEASHLVRINWSRTVRRPLGHGPGEGEQTSGGEQIVAACCSSRTATNIYQ